MKHITTYADSVLPAASTLGVTVFLGAWMFAAATMLGPAASSAAENIAKPFPIAYSQEDMLFDQLLLDYQALPQEGQTLFARKLKAVQNAVQKSDQATDSYMKASMDAKNTPSTRTDPQAQNRKSQEASRLGRTAGDLKRVAGDMIGQLRTDVANYRRQAQSPTRRDTRSGFPDDSPNYGPDDQSYPQAKETAETSGSTKPEPVQQIMEGIFGLLGQGKK